MGQSLRAVGMCRGSREESDAGIDDVASEGTVQHASSSNKIADGQEIPAAHLRNPLTRVNASAGSPAATTDCRSLAARSLQGHGLVVLQLRSTSLNTRDAGGYGAGPCYFSHGDRGTIQAVI